MNKYMRAKKFNREYRRDKRANIIRFNVLDDDETLNKKEFQFCCKVFLSLLVCTILYALCIHYNIFGLKDWYQKNEPVPMSSNEESDGNKESGGNSMAMEEPAAYIEHFVSSGETLWSIANKYHPKEETRKVIWAIRAFNPGTDGERMSANIIPGQVVKVPMDIDAVEEDMEKVKEAKEARSEETEIKLASRHDDRTSNTSQRDDGK